MNPDSDDSDSEWSGDWQFVGIALDGDPDKEIIEIEPEQCNGVRYRRLALISRRLTNLPTISKMYESDI